MVMDKKFYRDVDSHPIGVADDDFILSIIIPFSQEVHTDNCTSANLLCYNRMSTCWHSSSLVRNTWTQPSSTHVSG